MTPQQHEAWQEFEAEHKISENYRPHEQIIYEAFCAGLRFSTDTETEEEE